jgi:thioredoxin 1
MMDLNHAPFDFLFPLQPSAYAHWSRRLIDVLSLVKEREMLQELTVDLFQQEVLDSNVPVLVDFWSPGCGPCKLQDPVLKELADDADGKYRVKKINVWDEPELATRFEIRAVPTLLVFHQGEVVRSLVGYQKKSVILQALQEAA